MYLIVTTTAQAVPARAKRGQLGLFGRLHTQMLPGTVTTRAGRGGNPLGGVDGPPRRWHAA